jgi:hypothetical protein
VKRFWAVLATACAAVVVVLAATASGTGCAAQICRRPEKPEPTVFKGGEIVGDMYRTSGFEGDLLHFPGGAFYEIHHNLGVRPTSVAFFLSFKRDGLMSGTVAQAAGNQVELKAMDENTMRILNGSCADYYLIVQAFRDGAEGGAGGAAGAGGEGGMGGGGGAGG